MRRAVLGGIAATLLFALAACGGDDDAPKDDPTSATSSTPSDGVDPEDLAGIISDTPTDVKWRVPDVPSSWKQLKTESGSAQWQVGDACVISLFQPAGLGKKDEPTQEQVLDEYAKRSGQAVGATVKVTNRTTSMFPLETSAKDVAATTKVSQAALSGGNGIEGEIYAYRSGDFALVLNTFCARDTFAETDAADFQPFISKLAITATY